MMRHSIVIVMMLRYEEHDTDTRKRDHRCVFMRLMFYRICYNSCLCHTCEGNIKALRK